MLAEGCTGSQVILPAQKKTPVLPGSAASCGPLPQEKVEDRGLEPVRYSPGETAVSPQGGAQCGAVDAENSPLDPQLQLLIERWPNLSKAVQQQIVLLLG